MVTLYAAWGVGQVAMLSICTVALVRYRSLIPFLFTVLLFEHAARRLVYYLLPIPREAGAAGGVINLVMLIVLVIGLALSLLPRSESATAAM